MPIYEGRALHHFVLRLIECVSAEYLMKNLTDQGSSFTVSAEWEIARDIS